MCTIALAIGTLPVTFAKAADKLSVNMTYLAQEVDRLAPLSLLAIADLPEAENALFFNASAEDDRLRTDDRRANLFHIIPSRIVRSTKEFTGRIPK
jgi:hypothetical protein